jgi:uncharacterized protein
MNFLGAKTTDLRQRASGFQHIWYEIHICPKCGYSGQWKDFESERVDENLRRFVFDNITPYLEVKIQAYKYCVPGTQGKRYQAVIRKWVFSGQGYEFAAKLAEWRGASAWSIAWLFLKAAWCCVDFSKPEEERAYRTKAITFLEKAFQSGETAAADTLTCLYLIAENYRRIGQKEKASEWYDRTIEFGSRQSGSERLRALAAAQRDNPQEIIPRDAAS